MYPRVSVLVPVYNHASYLNECLNSLKALDYPDVEILLCDDGSVDTSYAIAEQWLQSHPQVNAKLWKQQNQGVCKTLNFLVQQSTGAYIVLCASDDLLLPQSLTERVNFLEQQSEMLACIGDAILIDQESSIVDNQAMHKLYKSDYTLLKNDICNELIFRWAVVGPTLLIRRSAYEQIGYYDERLAVEDRDFYLRLLNKNKLAFTAAAVAKYRIHTSNTSRRSIASRMRVLKDVAVSNLNYANTFTGAKSLFLKSHKFDLLFMKVLPCVPAYYALLPWRFVRKSAGHLYLSYVKWAKH